MTHQGDTACATCPAHNAVNLLRLGVDMGDANYVVALAGNPNTGKSTVFNELTGLRQHTGNWPGKTVTRAEGGFSFGGNKYKLVDLPGTYSLLSASTDEEIARNFILFGRPDVTIVVVDSTRLERNLNLVLQILEITERVVVCLNLTDEAERHGLKLDDRMLSKELGVPVVPTSARQGVGLKELLQAVHEVATGLFASRPWRIRNNHAKLENAISELATLLEKRFSGLTNARWVALRLLEGDQYIIEAVASGDLGNLSTNSTATIPSRTELVEG